MHPRSKHNGRYDFKKLIESLPRLKPFVAVNPHGDESIDFADPKAVKALNQAILAHFYNVTDWEIPDGYLCPPIPGRADYIHSIADLLALNNGGSLPTGKSVCVLDIGVGANCVYPLIGQAEYGWSFVGSEVDPVALQAARTNVESNRLSELIELRLQSSPSSIFKGILQKEKPFDVTICNPPFHASQEEAEAGNRRKWNNLGITQTSSAKTLLNFGGQSSELWCSGGELEFIRRMVRESAEFPMASRWFSTLVSKESNLPPIEAALQRARVKDVHKMDLTQGQKKSRIVAWTLQSVLQ